MITVSSIVEGDGEVGALPVLLRRLAAELPPQTAINITKPIRVRRDRFLNRDDEFQRYLHLAASECGSDGWILVLLDADDDCPAHRSREILAKAQKIISCRISIVLANREYEAWFIASTASINGKRGFILNGVSPSDPDSIRNAKGWITDHMPKGRYREITDQPAFSDSIDIDVAQKNSRSFKKLCDEWKKNMLR